MGRMATKKNKNVYQLTREKLELSREKASEILGSISKERLERIENEKMIPQPEDILVLASKYKAPHLCNYYCSHQCVIGKRYVPEIKVKDNLSQIVIEMLASLNSMNKKKERLIEIIADGKVATDEIEDFVCIQENLENISIAVEALQLWAEQMIANERIDIEKYNQVKSNK